MRTRMRTREEWKKIRAKRSSCDASSHGVFASTGSDLLGDVDVLRVACLLLVQLRFFFFPFFFFATSSLLFSI
jgi:hypothetical protein